MIGINFGLLGGGESIDFSAVRFGIRLAILSLSKLSSKNDSSFNIYKLSKKI